jgi:hypothetical protein
MRASAIFWALFNLTIQSGLKSALSCGRGTVRDSACVIKGKHFLLVINSEVGKARSRRRTVFSSPLPAFASSLFLSSPLLRVEGVQKEKPPRKGGFCGLKLY